MQHSAFVTGATGFLGTNLVKELLNQQWQITILHRNSSDLRHLANYEIDKRTGTVEDLDSLLKAIPPKVDAVFHVAASTSYWSRYNQQQYQTNVIGTRNVISAARAKSVGRMIHTSSIAAYGFHATPVTETTPSNALQSGINYFVTKYQAEQEVKKAIAAGLDAVILNPAHIIGPYDIHNWVQVFYNVSSGQMPGVPATLGTFAFAPEVAKAHIAAYHKGKSGDNYLLGGVEASMIEFVNAIESNLNKPLTSKTVPMWILKIVTKWHQALSIFSEIEPILTPEKTRMLQHATLCDDSRAKRELGFKTVPLNDMVSRTIEWLKDEKLI